MPWRRLYKESQNESGSLTRTSHEQGLFDVLQMNISSLFLYPATSVATYFFVH